MALKQVKFPALTTERLTLRAPKAADAGALRTALSFPEVTQYSNWPDGITAAQMKRYLSWMMKLQPSGRGCAWIIEERKSNAVIGAVRFNSIDRSWKCGELGYELHPKYWGKGLASEAVRAVVECGHSTLGLHRIEAWTLPGNGASDSVLKKAGFRYEGTHRQKAWFKGAYRDFRMFGRLEGDPLKLK